MADRQEVQWENLKDFFHEESRVCVRVRKLPLWEPRYSATIGMKLDQPKGDGLAPYLPGPGGNPRWEIDFPAIVFDLLTQAQTFIVEQIAERSEQIAKEAEQRAAKEREKRTRHAANVEARREANRKASKGGKGKGG